jgi:uncharacterized protein YraI
MKKLFFLILNMVLAVSLSSQNQIGTTSVNLNFRANPEIGKNVICVIPKGSTFKIDYSNQDYVDWIKINYKGKNGYVYSIYIRDFNLSTNNNFDYSYSQVKSSSSVKYYTNSKGERVQSPTYYESPPAGATAECWDGTYSFSQNRRGTCSHHGGVKRWLK